MTRCSNSCPNHPLPPGLTLTAARDHPRWKHELQPGARCALEHGHPGAHQTVDGLLVWHDPVKVTVV